MPRADTGWYLVGPLIVAGAGLGLLVSQLNNYTLAPISDERVSEAAGVNSAGGSFGLSFGLAFAGAIMLATLSFTFTQKAEASTVLPPADQQQVADALEDDAQVMSNTQLEELLADQPEDIQDEIIPINTDARPIALQVALLVPILAGAPRAAQLVPHDAPAGPEALGGRRGDGARLMGLHGQRSPSVSTASADQPPASTRAASGSMLVLLTLAAGQFLMTLDSSVMNVSIATVAKDVGTTVTGIQGAITAYTLVMAALMITGAKVGAIIGRKRAFGIGCVIYACGSFVTAIAPTLPVLLLGWSFLEGVGAALILPAIVALVAGNSRPSAGPPPTEWLRPPARPPWPSVR